MHDSVQYMGMNNTAGTTTAANWTTRQRRVIAEQDEAGWLVMWQDGSVTWHRTKADVMREVKRTVVADIDIASIEWRYR